ncbi:thermonuclease family protein [Ramlibacter sp.]|uniref:thermonuclease family protein n=1 Tax=Ramlibacter sp. TaxID=1917967 RepID=UPI002D6F7174|nr:thermonuclease family protein [Ramlibacter sp.]HYD76710.1 thermonuclease family protein [Ramlibacter sp.]
MRRFLPLAFALALALPVAAPAQPRSYLATVVHVTDGDTVWVRPSWGGPSIQVRIQGIDAPESCQAFGPQATQALRQRLWRQPVKVEERGRDDYRRTLARLQWSGQDVGAWLVFSGFAWSYRYRRDPGPYASLQAQARQARRGLWSEHQPIEPARFRKLHGNCEPHERR